MLSVGEQNYSERRMESYCMVLLLDHLSNDGYVCKDYSLRCLTKKAHKNVGQKRKAATLKELWAQRLHFDVAYAPWHGIASKLRTVTMYQNREVGCRILSFA